VPGDWYYNIFCLYRIYNTALFVKSQDKCRLKISAINVFGIQFEEMPVSFKNEERLLPTLKSIEGLQQSLYELAQCLTT
jgi:hypothetical protein